MIGQTKCRRRPKRCRKILVAQRDRTWLVLAGANGQPREPKRAPYDDDRRVVSIECRWSHYRYSGYPPVSALGYRSGRTNRPISRYPTYAIIAVFRIVPISTKPTARLRMRWPTVASMFDAMTRSVISWMTLKIPMRDLCGVPSGLFQCLPLDRFSSVIDLISRLLGRDKVNLKQRIQNGSGCHWPCQCPASRLTRQCDR